MYNLSICAVDGVTIYGCISDNKKELLEFLKRYDHEGSSISMVKRVDDKFIPLYNEDVYKELQDNV